MIAKKCDDKRPVGDNTRECGAFKAHELEWYGEAYEGLYKAKLEMDVKLKELAAKLQPRATLVH